MSDIADAGFDHGTHQKIFASSNVKLSPFWKDNPSLWFVKVEAIFYISGITTELSKYLCVVMHLDPDIIPLVSDIIDTPLSKNTYITMKQRLINLFEESNEFKLQRLLLSAEFSDEKPSILLQRVRHLAGTQLSNDDIRSLFLKQLPEQVREILALSEIDDLTKLAIQADKVLEISRPVNSNIKPIAAESMSPSDLQKLDDLKLQIEALTEDLKQLGVSRQRGRARSRSFSRHRNGGICFYHAKFGEQAHNCREPCNFKNRY